MNAKPESKRSVPKHAGRCLMQGGYRRPDRGTSTGRLSGWVLNQPELVRAPGPAVLHNVHALLDKMKAESARPDFIKRTATQFGPVYRGTVVDQRYLQPCPCLLAAPSSTKGHFDWASSPRLVGVANDVCQGFVNRNDHGASFRRRESQDLGQAL